MKLLTKTIERKIPKLYSTEKTPLENKKIVCKFFSIMSNFRWYVFEGERQENGDFLFFGLVTGDFKEQGYFTLSQLEEVKMGGVIPAIERDMYFDPCLVKDCSELNN